MIISDGVTSLTFLGTTDDALVLEKDTASTSGGLLRSQTAGVRAAFSERDVRMTQDELRALMNLLNNGAVQYYYTPTQIPSSFSPTDFPMAVNIEPPEKTLQAWGSEHKVAHRYDMRFVGVAYL